MLVSDLWNYLHQDDSYLALRLARLRQELADVTAAPDLYPPDDAEAIRGEIAATEGRRRLRRYEINRIAGQLGAEARAAG